MTATGLSVGLSLITQLIKNRQFSCVRLKVRVAVE